MQWNVDVKFADDTTATVKVTATTEHQARQQARVELRGYQYTIISAYPSN